MHQYIVMLFWKNFKKCLRKGDRSVSLCVLKIVLGGTTARRNTRCGGLYLFWDSPDLGRSSGRSADFQLRSDRVGR